MKEFNPNYLAEIRAEDERFFKEVDDLWTQFGCYGPRYMDEVILVEPRAIHYANTYNISIKYW